MPKESVSILYKHRLNYSNLHLNADLINAIYRPQRSPISIDEQINKIKTIFD